MFFNIFILAPSMSEENNLIENVESLTKMVQETDKDVRILLEESKFLTLFVSTSVMGYRNKKSEM